MSFRPDTPLPVDVRPACNVEPRRDGRRPSILLLHYTGVETAQKAIDWLTCSESRVSCHYAVDEHGRITQMVGSRRDDFATLEDAITYRCEASPVMASRSPEDQRETTLGVLRRRDDGRWAWKLDPAYVTERVK